jgi:hypothetical protein
MGMLASYAIDKCVKECSEFGRLNRVGRQGEFITHHPLYIEYTGTHKDRPVYTSLSSLSLTSHRKKK